MATDDEDRRFAERHTTRRSKSDEDVSDWINGPGQLVIVGVLVVIALWGVFVLVAGG